MSRLPETDVHLIKTRNAGRGGKNIFLVLGDVLVLVTHSTPASEEAVFLCIKTFFLNADFDFSLSLKFLVAKSQKKFRVKYFSSKCI